VYARRTGSGKASRPTLASRTHRHGITSFDTQAERSGNEIWWAFEYTTRALKR